MKLIQFLVVFLFMMNLVNANYFYNIKLEYDEGDINYIESEVLTTESFFIRGLYRADLISFDNKVLNNTLFSVPNKVFYDIVDENGDVIDGGSFILNQTNFTISLPYYENAKEIRISRFNEETGKFDKVLLIDVGYYAKDVPEDYDIKGIITEEIEMEEEKKIIVNLVIYGFVIFILLLIIIILFRLRKK